jgi:AAA domain
MTGLQTLTFADRQREPRGTSMVLAGPSGVGKTHAIQTLDPARTLVVDIDRGATSLGDFPVDIVRPSGWEEIADLFALIGGPNPSLPPSSAYRQAHFDKVRNLLDVSRYDAFVLDSITQIGRESYRYAETHPESTPRSGGKDTRQLYGQHARQMIAGLQQVQRGAPNKVIVMTAILERVGEDQGRADWRVQLEGDKTARELPGIVDHVITLNWVAFADAKASTRAFICTAPNPWGFPAKTRSDRLGQVEEPDLGKLIRKLLTPAQPATQED